MIDRDAMVALMLMRIAAVARPCTVDITLCTDGIPAVRARERKIFDCRENDLE